MAVASPLLDLENGIWAKYEGCQPTCSVKDRVIEPMLRQISKEKCLLLADWGAFALSAVTEARRLGRKLRCFVPEDAPEEFVRQMANFPEVTVGGSLPQLQYSLRKLAEENHDFHYLDPLTDAEHPMAYCEGLAEELWQQCPQMTAFVCGTESCACLMGTVTGLKQKNPDLLAVASPISEDFYGNADPLGDFDPEFYVPQLCDRIFYCSLESAKKEREQFHRKTGLDCGLVGGASLSAAKELAKDTSGPIIALLPSRYSCY